MLQGIAASEGIGVGRVMVLEERSLAYSDLPPADPRAELERFRGAVETFSRNTAAQAELLRHSAGHKEALILSSHIQMVSDPYFQGEIEQRIAGGQRAEAALEQICQLFIAMFLASGDDLTQQRAADIRDIRTALLCVLLGLEEVEVTKAPKGTVLVAKEISPSVAAGINPKNIVGIVSEIGGRTSHSAILARALQVPAVLGLPGAAALLKPGSNVIVDGTEGQVLPEPDEALIQSYRGKRAAFLRRRRQLNKLKGKPTRSASGESYGLACNISKPEDALKALEADGEGVGLFRTEFLFMDRDRLPGEEEQFAAYRRAAQDLQGRPLTIRTLDLGGDKALPYLDMPREDNPFLGLRGIRYCLEHPDILLTQLRAVLRASVYGDVRLMFPLISIPEELWAGKALLEKAKAELAAQGVPFSPHIPVGIMVETPSAAILADVLARDADFFSIGTNDLTGYMLACDRNNPQISGIFSPLQPCVLRTVRHIVDCAHARDIPVGMCGEAAADPLMTPLLMAFGLTDFSVAAASVLPVRHSISQWTLREAQEATEKVMAMASEEEISRYLQNHPAIIRSRSSVTLPA